MDLSYDHCQLLTGPFCVSLPAAQPLSPDEALANKLFLIEVKKEWAKMRRAAADKITAACEAAKQRCVSGSGTT